MKMFARLAALASPLVAGFLVTSCGDAPAASALPSSPSSLAQSDVLAPNTTWVLQSLAETGSPEVTIADPSRFTFMLTDDGKLQARADCNRASAGYALTGQTLSVGLMASTRAYCASAPVDGQYLALLGGESVATARGTTLELSSSRGTLRFGR